MIKINKKNKIQKKQQNFFTEPLTDKEVTAVSGISKVLGKKLVKRGFDKVIFLILTFIFKLLG